MFLSIVIPVYNEEANLPPLLTRLYDTLRPLEEAGHTFEIIFTNDGSRDQSLPLLKAAFAIDPSHIRIIDFNGNFGQHMAVLAAFEQSQGDVVITLDADLQNHPEDIPLLLQKIAEGHDYVGGVRVDRQDSLWRTLPSRFINLVRDKITNIRMTDQGCMLRAYRRSVVDAIVAAKEPSLFIPALAFHFSANPTEVTVSHSERFAGTSKYNFYRLLRLNFDLITGFSMVPLQVFGFIGLLISALSGLMFSFLVLRRLIIGPEADGAFTLIAGLYFLAGIILAGIGIIGEYLGRVTHNVSKRPLYLIRETYAPLNQSPKDLRTMN